jgi:tetratricopeptide (TPR) repeat protein/predicted Ser/Thr protein kinase
MMKCPACGFINPEDSVNCLECNSLLDNKTPSNGNGITRAASSDEEFKINRDVLFGDRYKIIKKVGRGGMGSVYLARDTELDIEVALKIIHPEFATNPRFVKQFKKEILLAREITHENIVRIHDFGEVNGIKFISMQYIEGKNLEQLISTGGSIPIDKVLDYSRQICMGLQAAHRKGIIHLDLKPHNILVDQEGKVYIVDFGLAKSLERGQAPLTGKIIATPEYISPEQAKGEAVDIRTDIYSFGCIMYEMLTGMTLFSAETVVGYIQKHIHDIPPMASKKNPKVSRYLDKMILKCLEKKPVRRYQQVTDILADLEAEKVETGMFFWLIRRYKVLNKLMIVLLLVLLGIFGYLYFKKNIGGPSGQMTPEKRSVAIMYFDNLTGDQSLDYWKRAFAELLTTDLGQSLYFRVMPEDQLYHILKNAAPDISVTSPPMLEEIARQGNVNYVVKGQFFKAAGVFRVSVKLLDPGDPNFLYTCYEDGQGERSFYSIVDRLTRKIKSRFNLSSKQLMADIDEEIGNITTTSLKALEYFLEGKKYQFEGQLNDSNALFLKSIEEDPKFALAYNNLTTNYVHLGNEAKGAEFFSKALENKDRVSLREQFLIRGFEHSFLNNDYQSAIDVYLEMLKIYQNDEEGNVNIADLYRNLEYFDKAIERLEAVLKSNDKSTSANINLIVLRMITGQYDKALELLDSSEPDIVNEAIAHFFRSRIFVCQNQFHEALSEGQKAFSLARSVSNIHANLGHIHRLLGRTGDAEKTYRDLIKSGETFSVLEGHQWLAYLFYEEGEYEKGIQTLKEGIQFTRKHNLPEWEAEFQLFTSDGYTLMSRFEDALYAIQKSLQLSEDQHMLFWKRPALHSLGLAYLRLGNTKKAEETAGLLHSLPESFFGQKHLRNYHHLLGEIAFAQSNFKKAIWHFQIAASRLSAQNSPDDFHARYLYSLAKAYYANNNIDEAIDIYSKITQLNFGRMYYGPLYVNSYLRLGEAFKKKGWQNRAQENFEIYSSKRKHASHSIPGSQN